MDLHFQHESGFLAPVLLPSGRVESQLLKPPGRYLQAHQHGSTGKRHRADLHIPALSHGVLSRWVSGAYSLPPAAQKLESNKDPSVGNALITALTRGACLGYS